VHWVITCAGARFAGKAVARSAKDRVKRADANMINIRGRRSRKEEEEPKDNEERKECGGEGDTEPEKKSDSRFMIP